MSHYAVANFQSLVSCCVCPVLCPPRDLSPSPVSFLVVVQGFTLTCQTYPCGPGLKVLLNQYDKVYERQYGQYEIKEQQKKKKKGFMGMF